jgi:hypothetical protein
VREGGTKLGWRLARKEMGQRKEGPTGRTEEGKEWKEFFFNLLAFETKPPITKILVQQHACMNIF